MSHGNGNAHGNTAHGKGGDDTLIGTDNSDHLIGGGGNDMLTGAGGTDLLNGGGGHDLFIYDAVTDSTGSAYDTIVGFNAAQDAFQVPTAVTGVDAAVHGGSLSADTFDTDLAAAIGDAQLGANHAALFKPDAGTLAGQTFLVIDQNGVAGYQAGEDLVVHLRGGAHLAHIDVSDFSVPTI